MHLETIFLGDFLPVDFLPADFLAAFFTRLVSHFLNRLIVRLIA